MSFHLGLVEDEEVLNHILKAYLEKEGWRVTSYLDGETAKENLSISPDLWILDIMLPGMDGYQLIKEIKSANAETPVIFISARDADMDRILGLELGSDDYLAKPFIPKELVLRVNRILNRVYGSNSNNAAGKRMKYGPYSLSESERLVRKGEEIIELTSKEFDLIWLMVNNSGKVFSREELLDNIWGYNNFVNDRVVDDLIRRVRKKVIDLNIETVYGFGYRIS